MLSYLYKNYEKLNSWPLVSALTDQSFKAAGPKVLLITEPNRISYNQVYPFLYYRDLFREKFDAEIRIVTLPEYSADNYCKQHDADIVLFQTWFTIDKCELVALVEKIHKLNPSADLHFLDSFAPTDLRLAKTLNPYLTSYIKKSLLKDKSRYLKPQVGDTNLMEYYSGLFDLEEDTVNWHVPEEFLPKLKLGPTFFTGPCILEEFLEKSHAPKGDKTIDVHARLAANGSSWYGKMRQLSIDKLGEISDISTATGTGIPRPRFMKELENSKICFSPFGYGEICWRDIEAVLAGAVLLKPSMEHLEMAPHIHESGSTYIALNWDYSDLEEKVIHLIGAEEERRKIAEQAYQSIREYLANNAFVDQFAYLFEKS
ncbi:glycosyltransferase family 1 protein [Teredinibacter turnerae]|uniref:glycosyltransferase family 1 protein n=1 Tax=Teredinibacter turnerae TaxID=2426 RepID=UPI00035E7262|nr:glycosyltransferase family 1 protein [Teredinibacter turnerae]